MTRIGSLFSGMGALDLAVEHVLGGIAGGVCDGGHVHGGTTGVLARLTNQRSTG